MGKLTSHLFISMTNYYLFFYLYFAVTQGGDAVASDTCPDPGIPENGKRVGSDFR